jgi:hypothetical protein
MSETMISRTDQQRDEPATVVADMTADEVIDEHDGATPASVVAGRVLEVEQQLTDMLKVRERTDREARELLDNAHHKVRERDSLDLLIAAHRRHVAAWRQVQVFVDSVEDRGEGALLATAIRPGRRS